jgi:hypothetical protein
VDGSMSKRLRVDDVEFALRQEDGLLAPAARRLGCSRSGLYVYLDRHPPLWDVVHDCRETIVDEATQGLVKAIREGDLRAILYTLSTLGKWRGFFPPKELSPAGQSRLPNHPDGRTDEVFVDALRLPSRSWDGEHEPPEPEIEADLWRQQEALIERQQMQLDAQAAQLEAMAARIRELEATAAVIPAPARSAEDAEDEAIKAEIAELMQQVRRKLAQ